LVKENLDKGFNHFKVRKTAVATADLISSSGC
jgi:hypothetical protein